MIPKTSGAAAKLRCRLLDSQRFGSRMAHTNIDYGGRVYYENYKR